MKHTRISDIEKINLIILILGSVVTILVMRKFTYLFSFAVASAIVTLNFRFLRRIIEKGLADPVANKKSMLIKLPVKFFLLFGLVAIVVIYGEIDIVFFLIGLSTVFLAIVINQIITAFSPAEKRRQSNGA